MNGENMAAELIVMRISELDRARERERVKGALWLC